jgi:hypothetical protein
MYNTEWFMLRIHIFIFNIIVDPKYLNLHIQIYLKSTLYFIELFTIFLMYKNVISLNGS